MKITIIMALYNVEGYLDQAIESVLRQSLGQENIKVILVDDHSTDNTYRKALDHAAKHANITLYRTEKNSGSCGTPRNLALEKLDTPYVMFLDPDDYYAEDACEILLGAMTEYTADLVKGSCELNGKKMQYTGKPTVFTDMEELAAIPIINSCAQLYKSSIIREHGIRFTDGIIYEDNEFYYSYLMNVRKLVSIPNIVHYYNTRDEGPETSSTRKSTFRSLDNLCTAYQKVHEVFMKAGSPYFNLIAGRMMEDLIWKISVTEQLTEDQEKQIADKIQWLNELWPREDTKDELVFDLVRKGQINLLNKFFNYVIEEANLRFLLKKKFKKIMRKRR